MEDIKKFAKYFLPYKWSLIAGIVFIFCSMMFGLLVPSFVGNAIDDYRMATYNGTLTYSRIAFHASIILLANAISGVFLFWQRRLLINTSRHVEYDMRRDFYASLVHQPMQFFHENRVGDLMARATNDLSAIRQIVGPLILYSFQAIFAFIVVLPILAYMNLKLTLILLLTMPLVSVAVKILGAQVHTRFEKVQEYFSNITAVAQENLSGVRVVRAYAQEKPEIEKFQKLNREYAKLNLQLVKFQAAMRPVMFFLIGIGFVLIMAFGIPMAVRGEISAGNFAAFNLYLQRMIWYLIALGYVVNLWQRGTASLKRFDAILETIPTIKDAENIVDQKPIHGKIEFRNLTFQYKPELPKVLESIDLTIEQGNTVAFVGKTGSGKSTLISLIPRLLETQNDAVFVDDISVKNFPLAQLRDAVGVVPQETFLFSDTISENIRFGVENNVKVSVKKAAEIANLAGDIEGFPYKYEQLVGERGISLSGGQKQRTAIARAVMRQPKILILDDSLSAVDTYTEEHILQNLREVREGRTTLIVSHRVSTVRDADLICVLNEGKIIERGTHDELLKLNGEYADLHRRQLLEEELAATN
jgi:ATP-binding cassette, subfamily B, multidrug efflux pump